MKMASDESLQLIIRFSSLGLCLGLLYLISR